MWALFLSLWMESSFGPTQGAAEVGNSIIRAPDENLLMAVQLGLRSRERPGGAAAHKAIKPDVGASHRASAAQEK